MKCVVLGGGGFLGSHLCDALLADGNEVTIFSTPEARNLRELEAKGALLSIGDFFNPADLQRALAGQQIVFHLVSSSVPQTSNEDPCSDVEANLVGTLRLLEMATKAKIRKIIFPSSGGTVYGIPQEIPIKESHPTDPLSSYGITKLTVEKYLHMYWSLYGLDYCVLRISNAYGERQIASATQGVIRAFLRKAIRGEQVTVWGDGSIIRDYVFASDIAGAFTRAANYGGESHIFNIGSGHGHSLNDIIQLVEAATGRPLAVKYAAGRPFDVPVSVLDISRARTQLGWAPTVGLTEGIARAHAWMVANGA
jgi:UDP-glucose 4-epimerase